MLLSALLYRSDVRLCVVVFFYFGGRVNVERVQPLTLSVDPTPLYNSLCTHT